MKKDFENFYFFLIAFLSATIFLSGLSAVAQPPSSDLNEEKVDNQKSADLLNQEKSSVPKTQELNQEKLSPENSLSESLTSPKEFVARAWDFSGKNDLQKVIEVTNECEKLFGKQAKDQEISLSDFPARGKEKDFDILNYVGTCLFIQAEALMNNGKTEEAQLLFHRIIDEFKWAQAWDPSRGSFWSVAEKSQASIDMLLGKVEKEEEQRLDSQNRKRTDLKLNTKGREDVIDYTKYGKFISVGTKDYHYQMTDPRGLSVAVGEGIYPNTSDVLKDPNYKKVQKEGRLEGNHWDFVHSEDLEASYFKWATAPEPAGIKLFYLGLIFEKAKMYYEAIKAYQAIVIHFPQTVGWTYWQTPWYPAQAAIAKIKYIVRQHPELNLKFEWAKIQVTNGFDNDISNDVVVTFPGKVSKKSLLDQAKDGVAEKFHLNRPNLKKSHLGKIKRTLGKGEVRLVQYENGHWQMLVKGEPYIIKGITYHPTKIGQSPDKGTLVDWMTEDENHNGVIDGPYDSWADKNGNNEQDPDEPTVGDFQLMKEMGVNTIREYHQPFEFNKKFLREMYEKHGIRIIVGDFLGKYTLGSGASWYQGTDYSNPEHRKNMLESVKKMVMEYKDEPYVLIWLLGNENNYGVANNADKNPTAYFKFVNEVALWIKSVDKNHPVAICNGDTLYLDIFAKYAPDVDIYGANLYRGDYGFGAYWEQVSDATGKPAFVTEYGCPSYAPRLTKEEGEDAQASYHIGNWEDIAENSAGHSEGVGNALGGVAFEWLDEWWKNYEPFFHDRKSDAIGPFPGGYYYEEWFGLTAQGNGKKSPFERQLHKSYFSYKEMWNER